MTNDPGVEDIGTRFADLITQINQKAAQESGVQLGACVVEDSTGRYCFQSYEEQCNQFGGTFYPGASC